MTVKELINELGKFDPNMEVNAPGSGSADGCPVPVDIVEVEEICDYNYHNDFLD